MSDQRVKKVVLAYSGGLASSAAAAWLADLLSAAGGPGLPGGGLVCPPTGPAAEDGLNPEAPRVLRWIAATFPQINTFHGVRDRPHEAVARCGVDRGHGVGEALRGVHRHVAELRVLGSYPRAVGYADMANSNDSAVAYAESEDWYTRIMQHIDGA